MFPLRKEKMLQKWTVSVGFVADVFDLCQPSSAKAPARITSVGAGVCAGTAPKFFFLSPILPLFAAVVSVPTSVASGFPLVLTLALAGDA